ncbi:MAG: hypothetical protein U0525_02535 [Patescibacteria group bacterium]
MENINNIANSLSNDLQELEERKVQQKNSAGSEASEIDSVTIANKINSRVDTLIANFGDLKDPEVRSATKAAIKGASIEELSNWLRVVEGLSEFYIEKGDHMYSLELRNIRHLIKSVMVLQMDPDKLHTWNYSQELSALTEKDKTELLHHLVETKYSDVLLPYVIVFSFKDPMNLSRYRSLALGEDVKEYLITIYDKFSGEDAFHQQAVELKSFLEVQGVIFKVEKTNAQRS